eukprot:197697-Lingulodinium_polyedra.AAC.1
MRPRRLQREWAKPRRRQAGAAEASADAGFAPSADGVCKGSDQRYLAAIAAAMGAMCSFLIDPTVVDP